ncbi:uncharacterized protein si:ch211-244b2.4 [Notolabrus celidotus]|uniref:uncharacterized protein si:ch211-244b2.4 n=1 Tax=Notolabrus celidotus TaxID=1203425 RepID=UPI00148F455E|nr:uncharacterized protein si:ch211-244b2.4 [Notolabrus celidotus]
MASAYQDSGEESGPSESESDQSHESSSDANSDEDSGSQTSGREPCKYYNSGSCRDGNRCRYLHVCKYALRGNCRFGASCKLNHQREGRPSSGAGNRAPNQSTAPAAKLTDGRFYQWQLNAGNNWLDIDNDYVIEAQYSLPHTKSIKIYNTPYGAVSIDFKRLKVYGKSLRVRRLDDGNTEWNWYCTLRRKWIKYGDKDSKGNVGPVKSADIERKFQTNPRGSHSFSVGAETLEIRFKDMRQVSQKGKRRVTRRPVFRQQAAAAGVLRATPALQTFSLGTTPQWQFKGDKGNWHIFKHRRATSTECSVSSEDIERKYQQNPNDSMTFQVSGHTYKLDFKAMTQTNVTTNKSRRVQRVMV